MNIGFDAKRAYHNKTGLGHFSQVLIELLARYYPEHQYYLFNPRSSSYYKPEPAQVQEVLPQRFIDKLFSAAWRSSWVTRDLRRHHIDLYHGLSHEIPVGISRTGVRSVVTIHDLIPEKYPEQYKPIDVQIYRRKFRYACQHADKIMAISRQTRDDIVALYGIPASKIEVIYQSCDPIFCVSETGQRKQEVRERYGLPQEFFLYVGSIIERKNLLTICKALFLLRNELDIPLVVVGNGGKYKQQVQDYIRQQGLENKVIFLSEKLAGRGAKGFIPTSDFPAIYQSAIAMIYPSIYEGFGMPVMEAICGGVPVITSNVSCLPEVGGPGSYYVDPYSAEQMAEGMMKIYSDPELVAGMREKGWQHARLFTPEKYVTAVMDMYKSLW